MTRWRVPLLAVVVVLLAGGCKVDRDGAAPAPSSEATTTATAGPGQATPAATAASSQATPAERVGSNAESDWRVTYDWAVPSGPVRVTHHVVVPLTPPPGSPLPVLVEVRVGDHPAEGFSRITFAFRGTTPSYEVAYVPGVTAEGSGEPVPLPGNGFLQIRFTGAQAHDENGHTTITASPASTIGYPTLRGYGFAGDFEGHVTYALGLQVAADSDQVLPIRLGELTRPDGSHVVAVDVRRG